MGRALLFVYLIGAMIAIFVVTQVRQFDDEPEAKFAVVVLWPLVVVTAPLWGAYLLARKIREGKERSKRGQSPP